MSFESNPDTASTSTIAHHSSIKFESFVQLNWLYFLLPFSFISFVCYQVTIVLSHVKIIEIAGRSCFAPSKCWHTWKPRSYLILDNTCANIRIFMLAYIWHITRGFCYSYDVYVTVVLLPIEFTFVGSFKIEKKTVFRLALVLSKIYIGSYRYTYVSVSCAVETHRLGTPYKWSYYLHKIELSVLRLRWIRIII